MPNNHSGKLDSTPIMQTTGPTMIHKACTSLATALMLSSAGARAQDLFQSDVSGTIHEFAPGGTHSTFASGLYAPHALAFDRAGNLFVGGYGGSIYQYAPDGAQSTFASGLGDVGGLAFDRAGNLYASDYTGGYVYEFTPDGTRSTFAAAIWPEALAFNSAGELFVAEFSESLSRFAPDGQQSVFASWVFDTYGMAFDGAGNLFVTGWDQHTNSCNIYEFTPDGTQTTFATGLIAPAGLAFNGAGNLFVADAVSGDIYQFAPDGTRSVFASGLTDPFALAFQGVSLPVPEPTACGLLVTSITAILVRRRRSPQGSRRASSGIRVKA